MAGEVEERILEAAKSVFLERGFEGASFEQIADVARAGKATIYARYPGKEALFTEVIKRSCDRTLQLIDDAPRDAPFAPRLTLAAQGMLERALTPEVVSLMRLVIAEAPRFPLLPRLAHEFGRQRAVSSVARIMMARSRDAKRATQDIEQTRATEAARRFLDLVFAPLVLRALMGEDLDTLRAEVPSYVSYAVTLFTAAVRARRPRDSDYDTLAGVG